MDRVDRHTEGDQNLGTFNAVFAAPSSPPAGCHLTLGQHKGCYYQRTVPSCLNPEVSYM